MGTIEAEIEDNEFILCNRVINPESVRIGHNDSIVVTEWDFAGSLTPEFELGWTLTHWTLHPAINHKAIAAFREGYEEAAQWPELELTSFTVAVTGYLNWVYQTVCASMNAKDKDHVAFAERETADLLSKPMTRAALQQLLAATE